MGILKIALLEKGEYPFTSKITFSAFLFSSFQLKWRVKAKENGQIIINNKLHFL